MMLSEEKKLNDPLVANALRFLSRATLTGEEVPAFGEVWNWLQAIGMGEALVVNADDFKRLNADAAKVADLEAQLAIGS